MDTNDRVKQVLKKYHILVNDKLIADIIEAVKGGGKDNIFTWYESNFGAITPMMADVLKEAEGEYNGEWIREAMMLSVQNNVRKWSYVKAILEGWKVNGYKVDKKPQPVSGNGGLVRASIPMKEYTYCDAALQLREQAEKNPEKYMSAIIDFRHHIDTCPKCGGGTGGKAVEQITYLAERMQI